MQNKLILLTITYFAIASATFCDILNEDFDDINALSNWQFIDNGNPIGTRKYFQGNPNLFPAWEGATNSYIAANYQSTQGNGNVSQWAISPEFDTSDGFIVSFYTRSLGGGSYPDRLEIRYSTTGSNPGNSWDSVGDFDTLLDSINPELQNDVYPSSWTLYQYTVRPINGTGRVALRYYVTNSGPSGSNGNYIGIDSFSINYDCTSNDTNDNEPDTLGTTGSIYEMCRIFSENFDNITTLTSWSFKARSYPLGTSAFFQGNPTAIPPHEGNGYIGANYRSTTDLGNISTWAISPEFDMSNGFGVSFWTRTTNGLYADRLEIRYSTSGSSDWVGNLWDTVGDFDNKLLTVNAQLTKPGYPTTWTRYVASHAGYSGTTGRLAFRYYVTDGGSNGLNSNYIGIDDLDVFYYCPETRDSGSSTTDVSSSSTGVSTGSSTGSVTECEIYSEGFDSVDTLSSWYFKNNADPAGVQDYFQGNPSIWTAYEGDSNDSYIGVNYHSTGNHGNISNWAITPEFDMSNGFAITFMTRTTTGQYPDRLEVRYSTAGSSVNVGTSWESVGDFDNLILTVNPSLTNSGYPTVWTRYVGEGQVFNGTGRVAFRYYVTDGGSDGVNSEYIGIDSFVIFSYCFVPTTTSVSMTTTTTTDSDSTTTDISMTTTTTDVSSTTIEITASTTTSAATSTSTSSSTISTGSSTSSSSTISTGSSTSSSVSSTTVATTDDNDGRTSTSTSSTSGTATTGDNDSRTDGQAGSYVSAASFIGNSLTLLFITLVILFVQ